ncbi:MAG TPA: sulfatase-like hydrolase/transferase [Chitinophagales bacterium]|nr:sulfatase-like hydrolase/transferase [Chitinophagales bacterium]
MKSPLSRTCLNPGSLAEKTMTCLLMFIITILISSNLFAQRPNFVIILIDDAHEKSLPPAGPSFLNYPSIQRIYQEGLQVCDAYCLQPLCNPSRYTIWTGMYPHVHGATDNGLRARSDLPTFFAVTASHGYHNAYVGKYANVEGASIPGMEKTMTLTLPIQTDPTMRYNGVMTSFVGNTTVIIDDTSKAWLAEIDTPFILGIGHVGTHTPIPVVSAYENDYNGLATLPDNYYQYSVDYPSYLYADTLSNVYLLAHDSASLKFCREKLFEIQSEINQGVENIFSVLQSRGILDNTMIIFSNDNGFSLGEHQLTGKGDATETSAGVPLFVRYPAWFEPGTVSCGNMIGLHDLYPTILEAAGIDAAPYNLQGQSLHYLLQPGHERTSIYLEDIKPKYHTDSTGEPSWRAVRTLGFKYVRHHCQAQVEELFDLITDPEENTNLVNYPAYADTLNDLRILLDSLAIATIDTISRDTIYAPCTLISCPQSIYYADADGDGYGISTSTISACTAPSGYVAIAGDCNDIPDQSGTAIHPGATDICNSIDDNCNGITDEGCVSTITTGSISGSPFCPQATLNVPFTSAGTFLDGNVYTAELSNKQGSFSTPAPIGTLSSTANSGTIIATIPSKPKAGTKFRIRVTGSNPAITGSNNGSNMQLIACGMVATLPVSGITSSAASLNWTGVACAVKYKVQYRKQGIAKWTTQYSTTNACTITGLTANTIYEYHVQTYCSESGSAKSGSTLTQTFTTSLRLASGPASAEETMSIHPNPAGDQTMIQFTLTQSSRVYIKVYDLSGREIACPDLLGETLLNDDVEQGDHSLLLNTNRFSKGVYLVKVISDFGIENQKLIVQ